MTQDLDPGLKSAIEAVQAALNTLPHGEAKKLIGPIGALVNEATWLQSQRDSARLLDPNRTPQAYWLLLAKGEKNLNHPSTYNFALVNEQPLAKVSEVVSALVLELNEELGSAFSVQTFKLPYEVKAENLFENQLQLKEYLSEVMKALAA